MGKTDLIRDHWHVMLIALGITALSLLSWIDTARTWQSENIGATSPEKTSAFLFVDNLTDSIVTHFENGILGNWHLSSFDNIYTYFTTREIMSRQAILGEEKWLFYKPTIADFEGTNRYTENEMRDITNTASRTQAILEDKGIRFAIMVAPNKSNIYSEYMPDIYHHEDISSTDILIDYMIQNHVNIVSPKQELLKNRQNFQLYYPYDTHWNQLGAYIGVKNVMGSWGIDMPDLDDREIISKQIEGNQHNDLAQMIGMRSIFDDETEYEIVGTCLMDWDAFSAEEKAGKVSHYSNPEAKVDGKILLVGDSFRVAMVPSLREIYSEVYVVHSSSYTPDLLEAIEPDYLVAEYVERASSGIGNIDSLVK